MVRIFHTADVHLGLKFVRASLESHREKLVEARLSALSRMVEVAMQEKCDLLVIAGDLFDSVKVQKPVVRKAAEILRRFDGMVVVLPGNHDFVQERSEDDLNTYSRTRDMCAASGDMHQRLASIDPTKRYRQGIYRGLIPTPTIERTFKRS